MWGVIWVREKELRLDIHLFFCTPIREPHLFPCDVKSENFFPFILHTSIGDNLKHPVSTVTYDLGVLKKLMQFCNQLLVAVEMSDYQEKLLRGQMTRTLARESQIHTLLRSSHFLQEQILMETM